MGEREYLFIGFVEKKNKKKKKRIEELFRIKKKQ